MSGDQIRELLVVSFGEVASVNKCQRVADQITNYDQRERLDRFVAAALSGDVPSQSQETDLPEFAKHICDIAEAVLTELERREKEGQ